MKKAFLFFIPVLSFTGFLSGCGLIGEKTANISIIYGTVAFFSFVLLLSYCILAYRKEKLFILLFSSVFVVNSGYYLLSVSKNLEAALWANRISYLGSVFLPMIMFIIIMNACRIDYKKRFIGILFAISIFVFLLAASPGYLDVYYKSVSLVTTNGVSALEKVYGPLHSVYLFYLLFYFGSMVAVIIYSGVEKKIEKTTNAVILAGSVFINICVWLFEQLVKNDFEFLSVSYIISELFLLGIHLLLQEEEEERREKGTAFIKEMLKKSEVKQPFAYIPEQEIPDEEETRFFEECLASLTPAERKILDFHLSGKKTKEIMAELCITENTVKFHNKNLYRKFGVASKKQLAEICRKNKYTAKNG